MATLATATPKLLTEREAAEILGIRPTTLSIWRATKRYNLPYVKIGKSVRYSSEAVEKFILSRTVNTFAGS